MSREALPVDELLSYAARTGDSVRVRLHLPETDLEPGGATMRLRSGRRTLEAAADLERGDTGIVLSFTVTGVRGARAWRLVLRPSGEAPPIPVEARLLAAPDQPVALLPGPAPATEMPPPAPRSSPSAAHRLARQLPEPIKRPLRRGRAKLAARPGS